AGGPAPVSVNQQRQLREMSTSRIALPTEIWLAFAIHLDHSDLRSLVLVSRHLNNVFTGPLYSDIIIKLPQVLLFGPESAVREMSRPSRFAAAGPSTTHLLERIDTDPTLISGVHSIFIKNLELRKYAY